MATGSLHVLRAARTGEISRKSKKGDDPSTIAPIPPEGKAAALAYSLALNHPFVDGNKRVAHAAMEVFLTLNGRELHADIDEQERLLLDLASGRSSRPELEAWLDRRTTPRDR